MSTTSLSANNGILTNLFPLHSGKPKVEHAFNQTHLLSSFCKQLFILVSVQKPYFFYLKEQ